ncbi:tRNA pseudouridine synthase A [Luminiphilus syltensis NOR5-1B]|uniref:tRNA pseudouridine synthase n=2 Tax=Luminiphilus TaxID=1341118 RepID=B8KYD4_9GAMM|nr:tRNA pseudouridine synthase A [Luminiphilus syltensis NOR5-1B]
MVTGCAGRTDTGVHGFAQIVHFDDPVGRSEKAWVMGTNSALPSTVRVHWAHPVEDDFHARFSAELRTYRYVIANTRVHPAQLAGLVTWVRRALDADVMNKAAQALVGEHDFSAFRAASCGANTPMRRVEQISITRRGDLVVIEIAANAFLHHMVRNIAGSLIMVGSGLRTADWFRDIFRGRDRTVAADTAAAAGLYLIHVSYPDRFGLPPVPEGPMLLSAVT